MKVAQSRPSLGDPMYYTVHGSLQARILEWVAYPFSSGSSWPRNQTGSPALQEDSLPTELFLTLLWGIFDFFRGTIVHADDLVTIQSDQSWRDSKPGRVAKNDRQTEAKWELSTMPLWEYGPSYFSVCFLPPPPGNLGEVIRPTFACLFPRGSVMCG